MNRFLLNILFVAGIGAVSSCSSSTDKPINKAVDTVVTYNYVVNIDDSKPPVIEKGSYTFSFDNIERTVSISTDMISLGEEEDTGFDTDPLDFKEVHMPMGVDGKYNRIIHGSSIFPCTSTNGMEVRDLRFELSSNYYEPPQVVFSENLSSCTNLPDLTYKKRAGFAPKLRYRLGQNNMVYTFWTDLYYCGKTVAEVMGKPDSNYENLDIGYRIKFDLKKSKATVVIYNAKFNEHMPAMKYLILPNLDVQFTNDRGYVIEAENVVPLCVEGNSDENAGVLLDNPSFPFTSFKFQAENNMVEGTCEFTVAGRFYGSFVGKYMEFVVR